MASRKAERILPKQCWSAETALATAPAAERAGLPADRRHPHCLKHALGFALVASNVHLAIVNQALGHGNIASTAIYAVPTDEQTAKAVNAALAGLF
jgi:site-specific recombinase XerD